MAKHRPEHPLIGMLNGGMSLVFAMMLAVPWLVLMPGLLAAPSIYIGGMIALVVYKCIFLVGHFHRPISYGVMDRLLVTSAVHSLHHSDNPAHFNRNYGGLLTLWDQLLGTYLRPHVGNLSDLRFGLHDSNLEMGQRLFPWKSLYIDTTMNAVKALRAVKWRRDQ